MNKTSYGLYRPTVPFFADTLNGPVSLMAERVTERRRWRECEFESRNQTKYFAADMYYRNAAEIPLPDRKPWKSLTRPRITLVDLNVVHSATSIHHSEYSPAARHRERLVLWQSQGVLTIIEPVSPP